MFMGRSILLLVMAMPFFMVSAQAELGHGIQPELGTDAPLGYESVVATDGGLARRERRGHKGQGAL